MSSRNPPPKTERDLSLDFIRVVATFLVICIHVSANGFYWLNQRHWWAANTYESIARISVPLFFMVTGALLLPKETSVPSILRRLWRITIPLVVWSVLYLLWLSYRGFHIPDWTSRILRAPTQYHLWYLYTLFGAYLFLPVMCGFFQANTLNTLWFVMGAWFLGATIVPIGWGISHPADKYESINWEFLSLYAGYIVLGAILYNKSPLLKIPSLVTVIIWGICTLATGYFTWSRSMQLGHPDETFYNYYSPFVALGAATGFVALRKFSNAYLSQNKFARIIIPRLARLSFGVYLIHALILDFFYMHGFHYNFANSWFAIPTVIVGTFATSAAVIAILQKIPLIRMIVPA